MADNSAAIAAIRRKLASGAKSVSVDGVVTTLDLDSLRQELRRLEAEDDAAQELRPRVSQVWLEDAF